MATGEGLSPKLTLSEGGNRGNIKSQLRVRFKLGHCNHLTISLAATIMALSPVPCDHLTSFNCDDKKARDVSLTCECHLSSIMSDITLHQSLTLEKTSSVLFCLFVCFFVSLFCLLLWGDTSIILKMKEMESVLSL